jgi:hypothetical protein
MPIKTKYKSPPAIRAEELRRRAQENELRKKRIINTEKNVIPLLHVVGENNNSILEGEYVNHEDNSENINNAIALPISKNNNNNNIIDYAIPIHENKSWTNWFTTPKATHIKPTKEVVSLTPIYKSNFNAGKSKKNRKNKKTKKLNKKIKKTRKLNKRRK